MFFGPRALGGQDVGLQVPTGSRGGPTGSQGVKVQAYRLPGGQGEA